MKFTHLKKFCRRGVIPAALLLGVMSLGTGCAPSVPPGTQLLASGHLVTGVAPDDGMVYVVDKESQERLYSGRVRKADNVSVNPDKHEIQLNGNVVYQQVMRLDHTFEVRFLSNP